jgi:hypothetical protein
MKKQKQNHFFITKRIVIVRTYSSLTSYKNYNTNTLFCKNRFDKFSFLTFNQSLRKFSTLLSTLI